MHKKKARNEAMDRQDWIEIVNNCLPIWCITLCFLVLFWGIYFIETNRPALWQLYKSVYGG
jgi:hypothetical protein